MQLLPLGQKLTVFFYLMFQHHLKYFDLLEAYGCMIRVGTILPPVSITADDKRLKAGKPAPDPFFLAADCLGYGPKKCVVFEDSPSGIRSGVASGATVIAVCTSHDRSQIENCGAHYVFFFGPDRFAAFMMDVLVAK